MKALNLLLKVVFVFGLLTLLVRKGLLSISLSNTQTALTHLDLILPAFGLLLLSSLLGVLRWHWLLRAQKIELPLLKTFELTMVGNFFNIALPGAVSGDVVKAYYVGKEASGARAKALSSILFDRIAGLSSMMLNAGLALVLGFNHFWGSPLLHAVSAFLGVAATGFVVFYAYLFLLRDNRDIVLKTLRSFEKKRKAFGSVLRIYEGIKSYHSHRGTVLKVLALSVFCQLLVGLAISLFIAALGGPSVPLLSLYVVVPLGLLVTAIPLLPGGIGTGHVAFGYLFSLLNLTIGADVFTLFALYGILFGALGGLIYLRYKSSGDLPSLSQLGQKSQA